MKLNLGCGNEHKEGYINIDVRNLPSVDIVRDILRGLPFSDGVVDSIYSENFLEHLPQAEVIWAMNEMWRVLKSGGTAEHLVPIAGSEQHWQDPTHLSHWTRETLTYFEQDNRRNQYYGDAIKPWLIRKREDATNNLIRFVLQKP